MKLFSTRVMLILIMGLIFILAACGGGDEPAAETESGAETAATPAQSDGEVAESATEETAPAAAEPTEEPAAAEEVAATDDTEAESEPETIEAPAAEVAMDDEIRSEAGGYAIVGLPDYRIEQFAETTIMEAPDADPDLGPIFFMSGGLMEAGETAETLIASFQEEFIADDDMDISDPEAVEVNGLAGYTVDFSGNEGDQTIDGRLAALTDGTQTFLIFAGAETSRWQDETSALFEDVLKTVSLFEPVMDEGTEESSVEPAAEEAAAESSGDEMQLAAGDANSDAGMACFGTSGVGLTCLSAAGEWVRFTSDDSPLGGDYITAMDVCADGTILIAHTAGISAFDGQEWQEYESEWGFSSADDVACDPAGGFWVAHFEGASHFDGSSWTTYPSEEFEAPEEATGLVDGVALDPEGNVWVVTANNVSVFDGTEWTIYSTGSGFTDKYFFDAITIDNAGNPIAAHSDGLLTFVDGQWQEIQNDDFYVLQAVSVAPDGTIWIGSYSEGAAAYDGAGWNLFNRDSGALSSNQVNALAVDGNGRVWAATEFGLNVGVDDEWVTYRMDNADLSDNSFDALAVVNGGPQLPEPLDKETGSLVGSIMLDGEPYANANVEVCVESLASFYYGDTPCSDQPFFLATTADADGNFAFDELPAGMYVITVQTADGWAQLTGDFGIGSERVLVAPGAETGVGELTIETSE